MKRTGQYWPMYEWDIFLSYAKSDRKLVFDIYNRLRDNGFSVWCDEREILPGNNWKASIQRGIHRSRVFLLCCSASWVAERSYVHKEMRIALNIMTELPEDRVFIIPVRLNDCEIPASVSDLQWVNLYEADGYPKLIRSLRRNLGSSIPVEPATGASSAKRLLVEIDLWDAVGAIRQDSGRSEAERVRDRILETDFRRLSTRDSIELCNELLRLEELFNGLIAERADLVLEMIKNDARRNSRQDQMSKAHVLYAVSDRASVPELLRILHDTRQDLDTRNAALRILWKRDDVGDARAVLEVRELVNELMPLARNHDEPAYSFIVGLCHLLLSYKSRTLEDEALARKVYEMHQTLGVPHELEDMTSWFRTQFTLGGLCPDIVKRG